MATLSSAQKTKNRYKQHIDKLKVSIISPNTPWTGRVNDGGAARGDRTITFDTGSGVTTDIRSYQPLWVGTSPGLHDVGIVRIKTFTGTTTGTITVDENGIVWQDNLYLTVKHDYPVEMVAPRIASQVFYKYYNLAYSDQNSQPPPICLAGEDRVVFLTGASVVVNFDLSSSYAIAQGATISSYTLAINPSGPVVSFNTGTGIGTITFTTAGTWWATASCTDSNGKTQERFVLCHVENVANPGYLDCTLSSYQEQWGAGVQATVIATGDAALNDVPQGATVIVWYEGLIDGSEDYVNILGSGDGVAIISYVRQESYVETLQDGLHQLTLNITSVDGLLQNVPMRSVGLRAKASPTKWWHYASWLTPGRAIHHLFKWQSIVLERHDFLGLMDNTQLDIAVNFEEGSLFGMANQYAFDRSISAKVTCDRLGRIHLVQDSQLLNTTGRAALDTVTDIIKEDVSGQVTVVPQIENQAYTCQLSGFLYSTLTQSTPFVSLIPGYRESNVSYGLPDRRGSSLLNPQKLLLLSQAHSNQMCGRRYAAHNRNFAEIRIPFRGNYLGTLSTIPSYGWYEFALANSSLARNYNLNGTLMICRSVTILADAQVGSFQVTGVFEPEAQGPDGIQGNYPSTLPAPIPPADPPWEISEGDELPALMAYSSNYFRDGDASAWTQVSAEALDEGCIDPWWRVKRGTAQPEEVIWWAVKDGVIYRMITIAGELENMTSADDPPNTWGDGTPPEVGDLTFIQILGTPWVQDQFFALAEWQSGSDWRGWLLYSTTDGNGWSYVELYDDIALPDQIRPIYMAVNGTYLLVTCWCDEATDKLKVLVFDLPAVTYNTEYALGNTTSGEFAARTYWAFPVTVIDDDATWYIAGRMNAPQALANPEHVITTANAGSGWSSEENTWGTDICMAFFAGSDPEETGNRVFMGVRGAP